MAKDTVQVDILTETKKSQKSVKDYMKSVALMTTGIAAAGAALVSVTKQLAKAEQAFFVQEKSVALLNASLRATGKYSAAVSGAMQDFASELQGITTVGDEASIQLQQYAVSAGLSAEAAKQATKDAIGLSKAFGVDLQAAIKATVNAQQGNYDMMNRYMPAVKNAATETEKAAIAERQLAAAFLVAQEEANTASGAYLQYQNTIGDTQEAIGQYVARGMTPLRRAFTEMLTEVNNLLAGEMALQKILTGEADDTTTLTTAIERQVMRIAELNTQKMRGINVNRQLREEEQRLAEMRSRQAQLAISDDYAAVASAQQRAAAEVLAAQEADKAAKEAQRQANLDALEEAYARTAEGAQKALEQEIKLFESFEDGPKVRAVLEELNEKLVQMKNATQSLADTEMNFWSQKSDWIEQWRLEQISAAEAVAAEEARILAERHSEMEFYYSTLSGMAGSFFGSLNTITSNAEQEELNRLKAEVEATKEGTAEREAAEERLENKKKEIARKQSERAKALGTLQATVDTAAAIIGFLADPGGFAGIGLSVAAAGIGAAQVAAIQSTPVPSYKSGGDFTVPEGYRDDSYMIGVASGERVSIQNEDQAKTATGGTYHFHIDLNGNEVGKALFKMTKNGELLIDSKSVVNT